NLIAMYAASSTDSSRKSSVSPTVQPSCSSRSRFACCTVVLLQPAPARVDHRLRCLCSLFREETDDHDRVSIDAVDEAPCCSCVVQPQLMAVPAYNRHRPGVRHPEQFTALEPPEQIAGLHAGLRREWRGLDFAPQPDQRLLVRLHRAILCQIRHMLKLKPRQAMQESPLRPLRPYGRN